MSKFNLDSGFLFLYDWLPALKKLSPEEGYNLMIGIMEYQKEGVPMAEFDEWAGILAKMIMLTVDRRLKGKRGGVAKGVSKQSKAKQSKAKLSEATSSAPGFDAAPGAEEAVSAAADAADVEQRFEEFFAEYPKHEHKAEAREAFMRQIHTDGDFAELLSLVSRWKESESWKEDGGRWIKRADKFLSEIFPTRDEPPAPKNNGSFDTDEFFEAALMRSYEYTGS